MAMAYRYKLTVRDEDGDYCTYESDHADKLIEQLTSLKRDEPEEALFLAKSVLADGI